MIQLDWSTLLFFLCVLHYAKEWGSPSITHKTVRGSTWEGKSYTRLLLWTLFCLDRELWLLPKPSGIHAVRQRVRLPQLMLFNTTLVLLIFTITLLCVPWNKNLSSKLCFHIQRRHWKTFFSFQSTWLKWNTPTSKSPTQFLLTIHMYFLSAPCKPGAVALSVALLPSCANREIYVWQSFPVYRVNFTKPKNIVEKILSQEHT